MAGTNPRLSDFSLVFLRFNARLPCNIPYEGTGAFDARLYVHLVGNGATIIPDASFGGGPVNVSNSGFTNYSAIQAPGTGQLLAGHSYELSLEGYTYDNYGYAPQEANGTLVLTIPGDASTAAVPEPASLTMLSLGIAAMVGYRWRRQKRAATA